MTQRHIEFDIDEVEFDHDNPRIKMALEKYGDDVTAERISFALRTAAPDKESSTASFNELQSSIRAFGGISQPITIVEKDGRKICIDGNTRLAIFKGLHKREPSGKWRKIPALLIEDADQKDIEKIRVSAHLVGTRQWPPYEKARYLNYLYHEKFMEPAELVHLCGGNEKEIRRFIDAFDEMNEYYSPNVKNDTEFRIDRFSGFTELQNPRVRQAIFDANFNLEDFGKWIYDGKIHKLIDVRHLPKILGDEEAREIFVKGGIDSATKARKHVEAKEVTLKGQKGDEPSLSQLTILDLTRTLVDRLINMSRAELGVFRTPDSEQSVETVLALQELSEEVRGFLSDVGE